MKYKLTLIAAFIVLAIAGIAQTKEKPILDSVKKVFTSVQIEATFPGGSDAWRKYLQHNLNGSVPSEHNAPKGRYPVTVSFLVDNDGTILDAKAENDPGYGTAEEAIRIINNSPKWTPAMQDGKLVKYRAKQSITFVVSEDKTENNPPVAGSTDHFFSAIQIEAQFPGGTPAFKKYLMRNLNSLLPYDRGAPNGQYTVMLSFIVDKDGTVSNVRADRDPGYGTAEEAIRVIKNGPKWTPAVQNGRNVPYNIRQAITFMVNR